MLKAIRLRAYANFFMSDRTEEYRGFLQRIRGLGFESKTVRDIAEIVRLGSSLPKRLVVLRHDIDTDPEYVFKWQECESKLGFAASYYFRLRTLHLGAMQFVEEGGGEVGYHFEEIASVARREGLWTGPVSEMVIARARFEFEKNLTEIRRQSNLPIITVASHGDFVNRTLGVPNSVITDDYALRKRLNIVAELYDNELESRFDDKFIDQLGTKSWRSRSGRAIAEALAGNESIIQILTHPRHWRASVLANVREDADRAISGLLSAAGMRAGKLVDLVNRNGRFWRGMK